MRYDSFEKRFPATIERTTNEYGEEKKIIQKQQNNKNITVLEFTVFKLF